MFMYKKMDFSILFTLIFVSVICCCVVADCPQKPFVSSVNDAEIQEIVEKHNGLREDIANGRVTGQPRGINLKRLKWDNTLAEKAQEIANTCVFEHVSVKDPRWWWVGQNLYQSGFSYDVPESNWTSAVQSWFDEHKDYTYSDQFSKETGHYTQVVWADTEYVGCGYTYFLEGDWYTKLYVCNYAIGGNIAGQFPYQTGDSGCEQLC